MADLAFIFGWSRSEVEGLALDDLLHWHRLAVNVWERTRPKTP